jgi:hypothetical protein
MKKKNNTDFIYWLIGFAEGDGSWFVRKNKSAGFEISQHRIDTDVLFQIKSFLGYGAVNLNTKQELARYCLTKGHYLELINIFNNRLKCNYRYFQFHSWCTFIHQHIDSTIPIDKINKDHTEISLDTAWLSGFIDAEGCFRIAIDKDRPKMVFEITQKEVEPLKEIAKLLSLKKNIRMDRGVYVLYTSDRNARERIIEYISKYPLKTKKRISYMYWKKAHNLDKTDANYIETILELKLNITKNVKNDS